MTSPSVPLQPVPDRKTRVRLAAHSGLDERTIGRFLAGKTKPHPLTERAIYEALRALGIATEGGAK